MPDLLVGQAFERRQLQLQEVVLRRVQVYSMDFAWWVGQARVSQDVVAGRRDGQHGVLAGEVEDLVVLARVLPCECVDELVLELVVLRVDLVKVHSPGLSLVVGQREGQVLADVAQSSLVAFAHGHVVLQFLRLVQRRKVWRLCGKTVDAVEQQAAAVLVAADPDVVRNAAQGVVVGVQGLEGAELVLQVVSSGRVQEHLVGLEPRSPEVAEEPRDVPVDESAQRVDAAQAGFLALDAKVHARNDARFLFQKLDRVVHHRVERGDHQQRVRKRDHVGMVVVNGKVAGVRHHHPHQRGPRLAGKPLTGNLAKRRRQVHQVDGLERLGQGADVVHHLDVLARAAANVHPHQLFGAVHVGGRERQAVFSALEQKVACGVVHVGLVLVELLQRLLLFCWFGAHFRQERLDKARPAEDEQGGDFPVDAAGNNNERHKRDQPAENKLGVFGQVLLHWVSDFAFFFCFFICL